MPRTLCTQIWKKAHSQLGKKHPIHYCCLVVIRNSARSSSSCTDDDDYEEEQSAKTKKRKVRGGPIIIKKKRYSGSKGCVVANILGCDDRSTFNNFNLTYAREFTIRSGIITTWSLKQHPGQVNVLGLLALTKTTVYPRVLVGGTFAVVR